MIHQKLSSDGDFVKITLAAIFKLSVVCVLEKKIIQIINSHIQCDVKVRINEVFYFYSLNKKSSIKHIKAMSYLGNLRVIIGRATKSGHYTKLHHF